MVLDQIFHMLLQCTKLVVVIGSEVTSTVTVVVNRTELHYFIIVHVHARFKIIIYRIILLQLVGLTPPVNCSEAPVRGLINTQYEI